MKSVKIIVVLLALVVVPALLVWILKPTGGAEGGKIGAVTPAGKGINIVRPSVKGGVTKKLKKGEPLRLSLVVQTSGRASNADWGLKGSGAFLLNTLVECESEIIEKGETVQGNIKVVEKRTFTKARQDLRVFDTDVSLALYDTLPMTETFLVAKVVGGVLSCIPVTAIAGGTTLATTKGVETLCQSIDGMSVQQALSYYGVNVPKQLENKVNDFIAREVKTAKLMRIEDVEGKSYRITYVQSAKGRPMDVNIRRFNADEEMSSQEKLLLRRANALIDWQMLKGESHEVGSEWKVDSSDFECLFDPYVEGSYCGEVVVRREADDADGDWMLKVCPGFVRIVSDKKKSKTTGKVRIDDGSVKVDEPNCQVKAMQIVGKAGANNLSEHHLLFKAHVDGECSFRATLTSEPIKK